MKTIKIKNVEIPIEDIRQAIKDNPDILKKDAGFKEGYIYWFVDNWFCVNPTFWNNLEVDYYRLETGNAFKTEAEAEQKHKELQALVRVNKYIRENNLRIENVDWEDGDQRKYYIYYDHYVEGFDWNYSNFREEKHLIGNLKEAPQQVIDNCLEDLKIIWGIKS